MDKSEADHPEADHPEAHTQEHQAKTFDDIINGKCFQATGSKTSLKTWLSWLGAAQSIVKTWHTWLLLTCYLCLQRGVFKSGSGCPVFGCSPTNEVQAIVEAGVEDDNHEGEEVQDQGARTANSPW